MRVILVPLLIHVATACSHAPESSIQRAESPSEAPPLITLDMLTYQRLKDEQVLRALVDAGSDLTKPHVLEHHFVCADGAAAKPVVVWAAAAGYEASRVSEGKSKGHRRAYFDLVKRTVPTMANITSQTTTMLELAAKYGINYDGWGCEVVK